MTKKLFVFVLVFACLIAGIYFRFYAFSLPVLDLVARQEVLDEESKMAKKIVEEKYPGFSAVSKGKIIERFLKENTGTHNLDLEVKIDRRSEELKNRFRDNGGNVYLAGIDSYYWLRLLENLIKNGHVGDRVVDGIEYDDLIGAPVDSASRKSMHIWMGLACYKVVSFINPGVPLSNALFYLPLFLSVIIGVFSFFAARQLGADDLGAFFASVAINLSPFFLERSIGEWFDTDIYNVLFPLLVFGTFVFCFKDRNLLKRVFFCCLSAFFLACYAATWKGWWFIFDIMLVSYFIFIVNLKLALADERQEEQAEPKKAGEMRGHWFLLAIFFFSSSLFVVCMNGFSVWKDFFIEPLNLWNILQVTPQALWPNVYRTVAELKGVNSFELMMVLGGSFVFFTALTGLLYLFLFKKTVRDERYGFGILAATLWIVIIFCATLQAFRFALLLVVPLGLAFGLSFTAIYQLVESKIKNLQRKKLSYLCRFSVVAVFSGYLFLNISHINAKLLPVLPQMTDEWHSVLTKIKNETPENAIINSWWDFGHWFKALGSRRVLFDGMTQNTPYAYWMAKALLSDKEDEAAGILRMINVNDNKAVDFLEKQDGMNLVKAVELVQKACGMAAIGDAQAYLVEHHLSVPAAKEAAALLFPERLPPVYFIVSYDMIAKVGAITYIGNWDFRKVDAWFKHQEFSKDEFLIYAEHYYGMALPEAVNLDLEISFLDDDEAKAWFSKSMYHTSPLSDVKKKDTDLLFFANGLALDLKSYHGYVASEFQEKQGTPEYVFYMDGDKIIEVAQQDSDKAFSALLVPKGDSYQSILTDALFARSMLARLYFFKGRGLKHFKLFAESEDKDGNAIYCYKIEWPQGREVQGLQTDMGKVKGKNIKARARAIIKTKTE